MFDLIADLLTALLPAKVLWALLAVFAALVLAAVIWATW